MPIKHADAHSILPKLPARHSTLGRSSQGATETRQVYRMPSRARPILGAKWERRSAAECCQIRSDAVNAGRVTPITCRVDTKQCVQPLARQVVVLAVVGSRPILEKILRHTHAAPFKRLTVSPHRCPHRPANSDRISPLTWSPLTESNRRPSPYHGSCLREVGPARGDHQDLPSKTRPGLAGVGVTDSSRMGRPLRSGTRA
jgi:hypothetical protein